MSQMRLIDFSRLMEATEYSTPTRSINVIARGEHCSELIQILSLELEPNNVSLARATKWISSAFGLFHDEIVDEYDYHGELGDAIFFFDEDYEGDGESPTLRETISLLEMDCRAMDSDSFRRFSSAIRKMSSLERKWFIRYWIRKPRNSLGASNVQKLLKKMYPDNYNEQHFNSNSNTSLYQHYSSGMEVRMTLMHGQFVKPMLAKVVEPKKWPSEVHVDVKYDGNRYQIHKTGSNVLIFNRRGKVVTEKFPDVEQTVLRFPVDAVLDTEIYPVENGRPAPHQRLGTRIHSKNVEEAIEKVPVKLAIFDILSLDGLYIIDRPLRERLQLLQDNFGEHTAISYIMDEVSPLQAYQLAINDGFEGIMVKDLNDTYHPGKRKWIKHKPPQIDLDVVIIGGRYGDGKRSNVYASFDIAVKSEDGFLDVGSIGTGFTDLQFRTLTNRLRKILDGSTRKGSELTYHFLPRVVLEITADAVTTDDNGNIGLRFPRCKRIREDKPVSDINNEDDIRELIE